LPDVDDDDRDVIWRAGKAGHSGELPDGIRRIVSCGQDVPYHFAAHHRAQPVGAQQVAITGTQLTEDEIG
jgi:hypothetical protein